MATIREENLPVAESLTTSDYFRIVNGNGASERASAAGILNDISALQASIGVEEIAQTRVSINGAFTILAWSCYRIGKRVFISVEAQLSSYVAGNTYTFATFPSDLTPTKFHAMSGFTTDSGYAPKGIVTTYIDTSRTMKVNAQNTTGAYWFMNGSFEIA